MEVNDRVLASLREKARQICPNGCKGTLAQWQCQRCILMAEFAYRELVLYGAIGPTTLPREG